jgi:demethylmenaquinone methyltransferase/2-methoxy-6-polyprenyl-1,4-benzoquinol methylase
MKKYSIQDKERAVQRMFSAIAGSYDLNNTLLSFGLHHIWKRVAVQKASVAPGDRVIDLCSGTADIALLLAEAVGPKGKVIALDLNREMLAYGEKKIRKRGLLDRVTLCEGNIESLSFGGNEFSVATVGFGIRNVVNIPRAFREVHRVLRPGGRMVCLEFSRPCYRILRFLYNLYSFTLLPRIGQIISRDTTGVYRYLPDSIRQFPDQEALKSVMLEAGFSQVDYTNLSGGIVAIHRGVK